MKCKAIYFYFLKYWEIVQKMNYLPEEINPNLFAECQYVFATKKLLSSQQLTFCFSKKNFLLTKCLLQC